MSLISRSKKVQPFIANEKYAVAYSSVEIGQKVTLDTFLPVFSFVIADSVVYLLVG